MKVVLINPISELARLSDAYYNSVPPMPPLGLAYLAAVLRSKNIEVFIEDQYAIRISNKELVSKIKSISPQVVGFSCLTTAMSNVEEMVRQIKEGKIDTKVILGNIHATIFPEEMLKKGIADIIVRGEGEETLLETVISLDREGDLAGVLGISYIHDGKIKHNPEREIIKDLDSLPYPDWHSLDLGQYKRYPALGIYSKVLPIQASRGCLYNCIFCSQDKIYKKPRYRDINKVVNEVEYLHDEFRINCVGFTDAYFPFSKNSGLEFCDELIRRKLHKKIKWFTETRVDMVDLELIQRMKEASVHLIMYGFETGNQRVLDDIGKKTTLGHARKAMELTHRFKIRSIGLFMLGLPSDTKETCYETISFAKELDPDICKFNIAVPYPGSRFFKEYRSELDDIDGKSGRFTSWSDWSSHDGEIIYSPNSMSKKELVNLQRKGMFDFYIRPRIIFRSLLSGTFSFIDLLRGASLLFRNYLKMLNNKLIN